MSSVLTIPDPRRVDYQSAPVDTPDFIGSLWSPAFPSADDVDQAAALLPEVARARRAEQPEGPRFYIRVGPGVLEVRSRDFARADRAHERELHRHQVDAEQTAALLLRHERELEAARDDPELTAALLLRHERELSRPDPTRSITEWSRKSRSRMVMTLGQLDFTPMFADPSRLPAMLTLTYPGDWLTVVPTGRALKAHLKALRKRYERAWGETLRCVWKLEFQRRGAPHVHMLMVPPHGMADELTFRAWVSRAWADIVGHPDPEEYRRHLAAGTGVDYAEGLRARDPKRVGVYFSKHGSFSAKEYQNRVPEEWQAPGSGPGRFWGYWGLQKHTAAVEVEPDTAVHAARLLRRWSAAQGVTREIQAPRTSGGRPVSAYPEVIGLAGKLFLASQEPTRRRKVRRRVRHLRQGRGFVMVTDGAQMCRDVAWYLTKIIGNA